MLSRFPELELKARIDWMVTVLESHLPADLPAALDILRRALPPPLDPSRTDDDFGEFIWVVPGEYVARHGCREEHLERSLTFLRDSTQRFSAEYAIRPFLAAYPDRTLAFLRTCVVHEHYHVRRWVSEGTRPYLPWGKRVVLEPRLLVELIDPLHADSSRYVTRSVANHLNDLTKIDPDRILQTLRSTSASTFSRETAVTASRCSPSRRRRSALTRPCRSGSEFPSSRRPPAHSIPAGIAPSCWSTGRPWRPEILTSSASLRGTSTGGGSMMYRSMPLVVATLFVLACAAPESPRGPAEATPETAERAAHVQDEHERSDLRPGGSDDHRHQEGMPHRFEEAEEWAERFDDPARDAWQQPAAVVAAMDLVPGMRVADIGAGTGYFEPHLSLAVGPGGTVLALDIEPDMVRYLEERAVREKLSNVVARRVDPDDPGLAPRSVDRVLVVNTWHHIGERRDYAAKLAASLRRNGAVVIVDFKLDSRRGPPREGKLSPAVVSEELEAAGFAVEVDETQLPDQYIAVGRVPQAP